MPVINISVGFRKSRAKDSGRAGVVYLRLTGPRVDGSNGALSFNTDIKGADENVIGEHKGRLVGLIRLVYDEIERLDRNGEAVTIEAVAEKCRRFGPESRRSGKDTPLRSDLVSVRGQFKDSFMFTTHEVKPESGSEDLLGYTAMKSRQCRQQNRICTSRSYGNLQKELREYCGADSISWEKVNAGMVKDFGRWLTGQGYKASTRAYYLGMLRTILFQAREEGYCKATSEWFRPARQEAQPMPAGKPERKLDLEVVRKIAALDLGEKTDLAMVRDMFLFAFYCRGMELVDVAHLTRDNIISGSLVYHRRLTGKEQRVPLDREALGILSRYDNGGRYLFPLMETGRSTLFTTRRNIVVMKIKEIGIMVGYPGLTFVSNIAAWRSFVSEICISDGLHYYSSGA